MDYQELNLDELGFLGRGKSKHRPRNDPALFGGDYPFIQTGDVKAANLHVREYSETYNETGLAQSKLWGKGTLLITIAANIAETAVLDIKACFPDSVVGFIPDESKVNAYFIKYYIDFIKREMQNISHGTTQDNLSLDKLRLFKFKIPPKTKVDEITDILLSYDRLIENNNRRIAILEEMAQSLYREWFVKFRFPGYENVKFIDSPLGKVPDGWVEKVPEHIDFKEGPGLRKWQYRESGIPFLNIRTLINNDIDFSKVQFIDKEEVEKKYRHFLLKKDDHVVSSSGTLGRLVTIRSDHLPLMLNTSIIRMRPCGERVGEWQLKHYLLSDYFQNQIKSFAIGAAQPNYGPSHLKQMYVIAPEINISEIYEGLVAPIEEKINVLARKNKNLQSQRDMVLPKLMSGRILFQG